MDVTHGDPIDAATFIIIVIVGDIMELRVLLVAWVRLSFAVGVGEAKSLFCVRTPLVRTGK